MARGLQTITMEEKKFLFLQTAREVFRLNFLGSFIGFLLWLEGNIV